MRLGSCHRCPGCQHGDFAACKHAEFVGLPETIMLQPKAGASVRLSRNALSDLGVKLASEVAYKEIIAVELAYGNESFMLGAVLSESGPRTVTTPFESFLGQFKHVRTRESYLCV